MRTCLDCKETKSQEFFTRGKGNLCKPCSNTRQKRWRELNPNKFSQYCKSWRKKAPEKQASSAKNWRSKHPDYHKNYNLVRRYDLTLEEYLVRVKDQDGRCAICKREAQLYVDHNHTTDAVRELLCDPCNKSIGLMKEDPEALRRAADYLEKHTQPVSQSEVA